MTMLRERILLREYLREERSLAKRRALDTKAARRSKEAKP